MTVPVQLEADLPIVVSTPGLPDRYRTPAELMEVAAALEEQGYAGIVTRETNADPFAALTAAAAATSHVELGTAVAIALARSPMTLASTAHQLQAHSGGRLVLGLGSQVRAHVTRRFSMPWDRPAAQLEAHIQALRAIWTCWRTGEELAHESEYFTFNLMPEAFRPPAHGHPDPPVLVGAVGPVMVQMATRTADGLITHPFTTHEYVRDVTLPNIAAGLAAAGRSRADFTIHGSVLTACGQSRSEREDAIGQLRKRIAFYGSTPAYRPVLEHHGWGQVGDRLHELSRSGDSQRWSRMAALVPVEMERAFGIAGDAGEIRAQAQDRFTGLLDRVRGDGLTPG